MDDVHVSGEALVAWLAALALARYGLGGSVAVSSSESAESAPVVVLSPAALALLRTWDLADDLLREVDGEHDGPDAAGRLVVAADTLLAQVRRRLDGFGLFAEGRGAARLHVHAGADVSADVVLSPAPGVAIVELGAGVWRIAGLLRGWLQRDALAAPGTSENKALPAATVRYEAGELPLHALFDVRLVLLTRASDTAHWAPAVAHYAPAVPLDLITLGAGGRFETDPADANRLLGASAGGACLVAPGGELLRRWTDRPADRSAALREALLAAGVVPDVLP